MEIIKWSEGISVNNYEIDNQHKYLFQLTNNLILNSNAKVNSEIIGEKLQKLYKFITTIRLNIFKTDAKPLFYCVPTGLLNSWGNFLYLPIFSPSRDCPIGTIYW